MLANNPIVSYQETAQLPIEIYIKKPSQFIIDNTAKLLPNWKSYPSSIIIVLLYAKIPIEEVNQAVEQEKKRLKKEFLRFANDLKIILQQEKYFVEIIDPQQGKPIKNDKKFITFDMIAIVNQLLGYTFKNTDGGCKILNHPIQKTAIYPSILLSDGCPKEIIYILQNFF